MVDDDPAVTATLRRGLAYEGYTVEVASSGAAALSAVQDQRPDATLLDWELPDMSGISVLERLRSRFELPVILLTAHRASGDNIAGLDRGADGYLVKPYDLDEPLARLRAVTRRYDVGVADGALHFAGLRLDPLAYQAGYNGVDLGLVGKEFSIFELLLRQPRQVITRDTFYERVWNDDFGGGNSIEVFISLLRRKLDRVGGQGLVQTVRGARYTLREAA